MGAKSSIEWTEASWTPIRARNVRTGKVGWHCVHASTGCKFCYAEGINARLGTGLPFKPGHLNNRDIEMFLDEEMLTAPLRWRRPRMIFVCSMTDLFAEFVEDWQIAWAFGVMTCASQHTYQVLTKRADRMQKLVGSKEFWEQVNCYSETEAFENSDPHARRTDDYRATADDYDPENPPPNIWLGVSAERQWQANERIPHLLKTPAAVRFVSLEPLLGAIDLMMLRSGDDVIDAVQGLIGHSIGDGEFDGAEPCAKLDWVIAGGESGHQARFMTPDWPRSLRDQCSIAGTPFFFKQWGQHAWAPDALNYEDAAKWGRTTFYPAIACTHHSDGRTSFRVGKKAAGRLLDGVEHNAMPKVTT